MTGTATNLRPGHLEQLSELVTGFMLVLDNDGDRRYRQDPFTVALGDLIDRVRTIATGPQLNRFVSAVRGYFLAQFWRRAIGLRTGPPGWPSTRRCACTAARSRPAWR